MDFDAIKTPVEVIRLIGLMKQTLMDGFNGILDTGQV